MIKNKIIIYLLDSVKKYSLKRAKKRRRKKRETRIPVSETINR